MQMFATRVLLAAGMISLTVITQSAQLPEPISGSFSMVMEQPDELRRLSADIQRLERSGTLRVTNRSADWFAQGSEHERLQQFHLDLPVLGGEITRQWKGGIVTSVFGDLYRTDRVNRSPAMSLEAVRALVLKKPTEAVNQDPTLKWLGTSAGDTVLVYEAFVLDGFSSRAVYIDADSGAILRELPLVQTQSAVGEGLGVLGDRKKISSRSTASGFQADDLLRPPILQTLDLRGSLNRLTQLANGSTVVASDLATDSDNLWTDPSVIDAHANLGLTYDFLFKRFGFRGLNNSSAPMYVAVNAISQADCGTVSVDLLGGYCVQALWLNIPAGPSRSGGLFFGNGLPPNRTLGNQTVNRLAGAMDIVAHELTHGVTNYSSRLVYSNESGALNEAFSDMMGTAVEAYYQSRGPVYQGADYVLGEDVFRSARSGTPDGSRSLASPATYGDPDHYAQRASVGATRDFDNGGVHTNSGIANHAFFLAIEGGIHRVSGRSVTGVGFANREQIEKVFFRAFVSMLTSQATFYQARVATVQSARDLYGIGSAAERAVMQAWDAVGVASQGAALTTVFTPNPTPATNASCDGGRPTFFMDVVVSEFQGVAFNVSALDIYTYDSQGNQIALDRFSPQTFAAWFNNCGAGSAQIRGNSRACARLCTSLGGRSSGAAVFVYRGADANGNLGTFNSDYMFFGAGTGAVEDPGATFSAPTFSKRQ